MKTSSLSINFNGSDFIAFEKQITLTLDRMLILSQVTQLSIRLDREKREGRSMTWWEDYSAQQIMTFSDIG